MAIVAKENLEIENMEEPLVSKSEIPILKGAQDSEIETQRKAREATNKEVMRVYEIAEDKNNREKTKI